MVIDVGAMDGMAYVPEAGAANYEIMKEIYGTDLRALNPDGETVHQDVWETRSRDEWLRLAEKYQFTDVMTEEHWQLKLPLVMRRSPYALYHVPKEKRGQATFS